MPRHLAGPHQRLQAGSLVSRNLILPLLRLLCLLRPHQRLQAAGLVRGDLALPLLRLLRLLRLTDTNQRLQGGGLVSKVLILRLLRLLCLARPQQQVQAGGLVGGHVAMPMLRLVSMLGSCESSKERCMASRRSSRSTGASCREARRGDKLPPIPVQAAAMLPKLPDAAGQEAEPALVQAKKAAVEQLLQREEQVGAGWGRTVLL